MTVHNANHSRHTVATAGVVFVPSLERKPGNVDIHVQIRCKIAFCVDVMHVNTMELSVLYSRVSLASGIYGAGMT